MVLKAVNCLCFYFRGINGSFFLQLMLESRLSVFMAKHIFVKLCFFVCCNKLDLSASRVHESLYLSLICAEVNIISLFFPVLSPAGAMLGLMCSSASKPHS